MATLRPGGPPTPPWAGGDQTASGAAVVEAGIVEAGRVLEVDPAPHPLSGVTVGQIEQELQHAHRRQLRRRSPGARPGTPCGEVLVLSQAVKPVPHPHRRRPDRVAGPRHPRSQLRDLDPQRGRVDIKHSSGISRDSCPARPTPGVTAVSQISRFPIESSLELLGNGVWPPFRGRQTPTAVLRAYCSAVASSGRASWNSQA
jgi:hypothetical protein